MRRKLRKVGKILHVSKMAPNILIAKVSEYLHPGLVIYNDKLEQIGVVIETFGPVASPFARIKMSNTKAEIKSDTPIFIITGEKTKVFWRKMPGYKRRKRR